MLASLPVSYIFVLTCGLLNVLAVWISPINQNYDGPRTAYGDAYHGYWIQDISRLNDRFGTADDLKALIAEIHRRDMYAKIYHPSTSADPGVFRYIMVDVVVNNVMATSTQPDYSKYFFKDAVRALVLSAKSDLLIR
jgi:alpha-amylase